MALPQEIHQVQEARLGKKPDGTEKLGNGGGMIAGETMNKRESAAETQGNASRKGKEVDVEVEVKAQLDTAVKCPWCEHGMTTWCCQGWTAVVYLHQRHH